MSSAIDKESALFTRFRSDTLDVEIWYGILLGAAIADKALRPRIVSALRADLMPAKWARLFGAVLSDSADRMADALESQVSVSRLPGDGYSPIDAILRDISCLEDYFEMVNARVEVAKAAGHACPTLLLNTLEKQAAVLRKNIRNFQDGD